MEQKLLDTRTKVQKFVESKSFDLFIMSLICLDAVVFGLITSDYYNYFFGNILYVLDKLCMAIFIVEMILKLYAYKEKFFSSKWNVFDLSVITISSFSYASYFIVLRTFRLFRFFKYINRFSQLNRILNVLTALLPNFVAIMLVFAVFLYVFSIVAFSLFGETFVEFSTLGNSLFSMLQVFTLDGWASEIARPVMSIYPHAWIFFMVYLLISCLIVLSFVMSVIDEIVRQDLLKEISHECLVPEVQKNQETPLKKRRGSAGVKTPYMRKPAKK